MTTQHPGPQFTETELHAMENNADADQAHANAQRDTHAELVVALGEAITQAQGDALKLGGSVHGRYLQSLAGKWTAVFNRATSAALAKAVQHGGSEQ